MAKRSRSDFSDPVKTRTAVAVPEPLTEAPARYSGEGEADEAGTDVGQASSRPMTHYATRSALVAEAVQGELERKRYGRNPGRRIQISEPDGPSTDGGLKARQPILLVPLSGSAAALHCGWLDAAKMAAQLKSWDAIARKHLARFGSEPDLARSAYEAFLVDARRALLGHGFDPQLVVPDDEALPPAAPPVVAGVPQGLAAALAVRRCSSAFSSAGCCTEGLERRASGGTRRTNRRRTGNWNGSSRARAALFRRAGTHLVGPFGDLLLRVVRALRLLEPAALRCSVPRLRTRPSAPIGVRPLSRALVGPRCSVSAAWNGCLCRLGSFSSPSSPSARSCRGARVFEARCSGCGSQRAKEYRPPRLSKRSSEKRICAYALSRPTCRSGALYRCVRSASSKNRPAGSTIA